MKHISKKIGYIIITILLILQITTMVFITVGFKNVGSEQSQSQTTPENKENNITLEFFHAKNCSSCEEKKPIIDEIELEYQNDITIQKYLIASHPQTDIEEENYSKWQSYGFNYVPGVVVKNVSNDKYTIFRYYEINKKGIVHTINISNTDGLIKKPKIVLDGPFNGFVDTPIVFNASESYQPDGDEIISYKWDLGLTYEGSVYGTSVNKTYKWEGNYTITLTIKDKNGLIDRVETYANIAEGTEKSIEENQDTNTPGFEIIITLFAITIILFYKKRKQNI